MKANNLYQVFPPNASFQQGKPIYIPLSLSDKTLKLQAVFELELENGERMSGKIKRNRFQLSSLPLGEHKLTLIVGKPILSKGVQIYHSVIQITA